MTHLLPSTDVSYMPQSQRTQPQHTHVPICTPEVTSGIYAPSLACPRPSAEDRKVVLGASPAIGAYTLAGFKGQDKVDT